MAEKEAFITELKELIEKLERQVGQYRQAKFGPKSKKLNPAQLELALQLLPVPPPWRRLLRPQLSTRRRASVTQRRSGSASCRPR